MRFTAIAVSAAVFGVAMAMPASIVYETEIVTITSCAPEKTNCPGRTQTSAVAVATSAPVAVPTTVAAVDSVVVPSAAPSVASSAVVVPSHVASSPVASSPVAVATTAVAPSVIATSSTVPHSSHSSTVPHPSAVPVTYPNGTAQAVSSAVPAYPWTPSASAGLPSAPGNTSVPVAPSTPSDGPLSSSGATSNGLSFAAAAIAAAAFIFA